MKALKLWLVAPFVLAILLVGCNSGPATADPESKTPPSSTTGTEPTTPGTDTKAGPEQPKPASTDEIAAELKTAGYQYFGLDNAKLQTFTQVGGPSTSQESGQQTTYSGMIDGAPTFKIARTGATSTIGDSELIVKKDGLYTISVAGRKLAKPSLEVPADLSPGKKWAANYSFTLEVEGKNQTISQNMAFHAVAVEKITTKLGGFDALKIVGMGTMKVGDRSGKNDSSMWFVKDVGLVKMISKFTTDGVEQKMTMEIVSQK